MRYHLQGTLFFIAYRLSEARLLELPFSFWLGVGGWLLAGWGWLRGWPGLLLGLLLVLLLGGWLLLRWARRREFTVFVANEVSFPAELAALPFNERVKVWANGRFSLVNRDAFVWQRPADYWQVPLGEHVVMVAERPGRYLYQFFDETSLLTVQPGQVFDWQGGRSALAVTFRPFWGPQAKQPTLSQFQFDEVEPVALGPPRTVYLLFDSPAQRQRVWRQIGKR
jgi:hypothetical protein